MEALKVKLKDNVLIEESTGCWLWQRYCRPEGYGRIKWKGKGYYVHRLAYMAFNGEIPDGLIVRHACDTPQCCNPEHLEVGTHSDNTTDMLERDRHSYGDGHPISKLSDQEVNELRDLYEARCYTQKELGYLYGVSQAHISKIVRNKSWRLRP